MAQIFKGMFDADAFVAFWQKLNHPALFSREHLFYTLSFTENQDPEVKQELCSGKPVFTEVRLDILKERYQTMLDYLAEFVPAGLSPKHLSFSNYNGFTGVNFTYLNVRSQSFNNRYVVAESDWDIIPEGFLYDLKHIPSRQR